MIPSAKIASWSSAPPENRLIIEYSPALSPACAWIRHWLMRAMFTLGTGITEPSRNTARTNKVNSTFLRSSGVRNTVATAESIRDFPSQRTGWQVSRTGPTLRPLQLTKVPGEAPRRRSRRPRS